MNNVIKYQAGRYPEACGTQRAAHSTPCDTKINSASLSHFSNEIRICNV